MASDKQAADARADLLKDRVIAAVGDRYDIEHELGRGGMGVVYAARDVRLRRRIAIKVLPPELAYREDVRTRFLREAQTAAQLSHPHIAPIYAVDEVDGLVFFVMALIDGENLGAWLAREPRPPLEQVRRLLREVADALAFAHAHGVVHRDIKPDNILIERERGRAVVTDFGIARAAEADTRLTVTGIAVGTPAYMSPEQAMGEREVDGRSDLYSLGIVAYQMLSGELPFQASNTPAMLMKHLGETPRSLRERRFDIPAPFAAAVERALAKKPEDRWPDAGAFRDALAPDAVDLSPRPGSQNGGRASSPNEAGARGQDPRSQGPDAAPSGPTVYPPGYPAPRLPMPGMPQSQAEAREWRREWKEYERDRRREWKEQQKELREAWRDRRDARKAGVVAFAGRMPTPGSPLPPLGTPERASLFRRKLWRTAGLITFLAFVNMATVPFPWVIFPALGMSGDLRRRWRPLGEAGLDFWDVAMGRDGLKATQGRGSDIARRIVSFRRNIAMAAVFAVAGTLSFIIGGANDLNFMIAPFVAGTIGTMYAAGFAVRDAFTLRGAGVRLRDTLRQGWRKLVASYDERPRDVRVREEAMRLATADVVDGPQGKMLRGAADDLITIRETLDKLTEADRSLIPDVSPTIDALASRIGGLAASLHRLDSGVTQESVDQLDARIASIGSEPASTSDRERRLTLLQRQRSTLQELVARRRTMETQLESALLMLQNVRFDLIRLRSSGVQAAIDGVASVTQEARALSREIGNALEAADEVRKL